MENKITITLTEEETMLLFDKVELLMWKNYKRKIGRKSKQEAYKQFEMFYGINEKIHNEIYGNDNYKKEVL